MFKSSCNECADILKVPENQSLTAIKRHVKTHETKVKETANKKSSNPKKKCNSNAEKIDISIDELNISKAQNVTGMSLLNFNQIILVVHLLYKYNFLSFCGKLDCRASHFF